MHVAKKMMISYFWNLWWQTADMTRNGKNMPSPRIILLINRK